MATLELVMSSSEDITPYEHKSFDELIRELRGTLLKASHIIPLLFEKGRQAGFDDNEIRAKIRNELNVPYRTMVRYLPLNAKHKYERYQEKKSAKWQNARLVIEEEEPKIPPPKEVIIEPEPKQIIIEQKLQEFKLPMKLVDDFMNKAIYIVRAKTWPKTNGVDYLTFKANSEGVLSLNPS